MIGALLGTASTDANGRVVVVARASYAIPCQDRDGELLMDVEFHKTMLGLHARVNPEERVVGWDMERMKQWLDGTFRIN